MVSLVCSIGYHIVLGLLLAGLIWTIGLGYLLLLPAGAGRLRAARDGVYAYPLGLLAAVLACVAFLLDPWLGLLGLCLLLPSLRLVRARRYVREIAAPAGGALARALPAVVTLPLVLGLILHGPTASVPSATFGDRVYYAAKMVSAGESLTPLRDLTVLGERHTLAQGAPAFLGAVLGHLPGFDPFLFETSTLPALLGASIAIGVALRTGGGLPAPGAPIPPWAWLALLATLSVGMVLYPSWLAESVPVTLALPLAFSLYALLREPPETPFLLLLVAVIGLDVLLTKGLAALPMLAVVIPALYGRARDGSLGRGAVGGLALVALLGAGVLLYLLPTLAWRASIGVGFGLEEVYRGLHSQLTVRSTTRIAPAFELLGQVALLAALVRLRERTLAVTLLACMALEWTEVAPVGIAIGTVVLMAVLALAEAPPLSKRTSAVVAAAAVFLGLGAWFRDLAQLRAGFVLAASLGAVVLLAALSRNRRARGSLASVGGVYAVVGAASLLAAAGHVLVALATLVLAGAAFEGARRLPTAPARPLATAVLVVALVAVAGGSAAAARERGDLRFGPYDTSILTPADRDIWRAVHESVPSDGLVFTSLTGEDPSAIAGWNYYPGVAGRQVYLAGWYDSRLRTDSDERRRRLELNRKVLDGRLHPWQVRGARSFESFWAVVPQREGPPPGSKLIHMNDAYKLYRIGR